MQLIPVTKQPITRSLQIDIRSAKEKSSCAPFQNPPVLKHYGNAHTDSDIFAHFTDADILQTGDTFWNGSYPFIDYSTGGSLDGQMRAAEANLARVTNDTVVIPGHGPVGGKADLTLFRDVLVEVRDEVMALKKQGQSLEEVVTAKPGARYDAQWGQGFVSPSTFVGLVYQGV